MTVLTDHLPLLAGAPNGIKKLRELILELAVRGKLVPQDANDEPASELLKRAEKERALLVAQKKVGRQKSGTTALTEGAFNAPLGWVWVTGSSIFVPRSGNSKLIKGKLFSRPAPELFPGYSASGQDVWLESAEYDGTAIILSAVGARCGKAFLAHGKWSAIANTHIVWPLSGIVCETFAMLILNNEDFWIRSGGAQPFLKVSETLVLPFALPPIAEQHRIVAKVDELMALCDTLETQQVNAESAHAQLVHALLDSLTQACDADDFAASWQRLSEHFDTLFTTEASIDSLKQAVLQLAVMGKLVPQDPGDEPASELVVKISELLLMQAKEAKRKAWKEIGKNEKAHPLPCGWEWIRISHLGAVKGGKRLPAGASFVAQETPYIYIQVTNMKCGTIIDSNLKYIDETTHAAISNYTISKNDLYVTIAGTIGDVGLVPDAFDGMNLTENAAKIVFSGVDRHWLLRALSSNFVQRQFSSSTNQLAQPKLALHRVADAVLAMPPLAEQHRIVAKVDELISLCDQLKSRVRQARDLNQKLASTLVERAVA